jgi:plastocyanin
VRQTAVSEIVEKEKEAAMSMDTKKENEPTSSGEATPAHLFARQPLSVFGKLAVAALLGAAAASGILAIAIGSPGNLALLIITASLLICAGLAASGVRWMPVLIALVSGVFLYQISQQPFVTYHLTNPKTGGFFPFVLDVLITACMVVTFGASIGATVQNYRKASRRAPLWLPAALTGVAGMVIGAILIAAIAQPGAPTTGTTSTNGVPTMHMSAGNFDQPSITIAKGSKLLLVDDVAVLHILANGSWQNGAPKPEQEPGAPTVENVRVNGNRVELGPFATAGTYHIYCTLHPGMTLTIIVQ